MKKRIFLLAFCLMMLIASTAYAEKPGVFSLSYQEFGRFLSPANFDVVATANTNKIQPMYSIGTKVVTIVTGRSYSDPVLSKGYFNKNNLMIGYRFSYARKESMESVQDYISTYSLSKITPEILEKWMIGKSAQEDYGIRFVDKKNGIIHELGVMGSPQKWRSGKISTYGVFSSNYFSYTKSHRDFTINLYIDNEQFDDELSPFLDTKDNRIYVPLRTLLKIIPGIKMEYIVKTNTVNILPTNYEYKGITVIPDYAKISISPTKVDVNGISKPTKNGALIVDGITYLPLNLISELFKVGVKYTSTNKTVTVDLTSVWNSFDAKIEPVLNKQEADRLTFEKELNKNTESSQQAQKEIEDLIYQENQNRTLFLQLLNKFKVDFSQNYLNMKLEERTGLNNDLETKYLGPLRELEGKVNKTAYGYLKEAIEMVLTQPIEYMYVISDRISFAESWESK